MKPKGKILADGRPPRARVNVEINVGGLDNVEYYAMNMCEKERDSCRDNKMIESQPSIEVSTILIAQKTNTNQ